MDSNVIFYAILLIFLLVMMNNVYVDGGINHEAANEHGLVFFTPEELKLGTVMPLSTQIHVKNPTNSAHFLPREDATLIPFSSSQLPNLLKLFGYSRDSSEAKIMEEALTNCESESIQGESKICFTSLESMLDFVHEIFGPNTGFKQISTKPLTNPDRLRPNFYIQNYTIAEDPRQVFTSNALICHFVTYPYVIYHCHQFDNPETDIKVLQVSLRPENGAIVKAVSICHKDTSLWSPEHDAFSVYGVEFGSPVCHFIAAYDLVWVTLSKTSDSI